MSEWSQFFYVSSISGAAVELSPDARGSTCLRTISRPPQLSAQHITVTTTSATPPTEFWTPAASCTRYRVHIERAN
jgi:hypothetical protein